MLVFRENCRSSAIEYRCKTLEFGRAEVAFKGSFPVSVSSSEEVESLEDGFAPRLVGFDWICSSSSSDEIVIRSMKISSGTFLASCNLGGL